MNPKFEAVKRGGYDMEQVDEYINHIRGEYERIADSNKQFQAGIEVLEDEKHDIAVVMTAAQTYARNTKRAANEQADQIISEAQIKADQMIDEAGDKVEQMLSEAQTQAQQLVVDARSNANKSITFAHAKAEQITSQAKQVRSSIDNELDDLYALLASIRKGGDAGVETQSAGQNMEGNRSGISATEYDDAKIFPINRASGQE